MTALEQAITKTLRNPLLFSEAIIGRPLRPYQLAPLLAIVDSIRHKRGLTYTVMFARQMGKNELSAHLEAWLLNRCQQRGGTIVKAAPTYQPQAINSKLRLLSALNNPLNRSAWQISEGHIITLGNASAHFLSGTVEANVIGLTASILLEIDEAQDFDEQKYSKDFRPMASSTNATTALYGTAWTGDTLLEHQIAVNKEAQAKDGIQRHFQYDYQTLAEISPEYAAFVEAERQRLGESHPLFRTQYLLQPIAGQARLFNSLQTQQLHGNHPAQSEPTPGKTYVAGIDLAGEAEQTADQAMNALTPKRDSVVVTIAELEHQAITSNTQETVCRVVCHYEWTGRRHRELYSTLVDILRNVWRCTRVTVDATGVGAGVASFLQDALGKSIVDQFVFTPATKSKLAYDLLAAVNAGRLKVYDQNAEPETARRFWSQIKLARYEMRSNQLMSFYVPEAEGHDDFLISLALCNHAAQDAASIAAQTAQLPAPQHYQDGRY